MGATSSLPPNGSDDFLIAEWERRLSYRRMGATTFLSPNGSNVFLAAGWEQRLPCRRMGAATFLSPNGTGGFLAARAGAAAFVPPTSELRPPGYTNRQSGMGDKKIAPPTSQERATRKSPFPNVPSLSTPLLRTRNPTARQHLQPRLQRQRRHRVIPAPGPGPPTPQNPPDLPRPRRPPPASQSSTRTTPPHQHPAQ